MEALKFFTPFGSSEFAVREFLKRDLHRTLRVMRGWADDSDDHVRRLASEGCRPRLPWSFRLAELVEPGRNGLLFEPGSARDLARRLAWAEAFPEKMRQMGLCARADYEARFGAEWGWQKLYGERRRSVRASP